MYYPRNKVALVLIISVLLILVCPLPRAHAQEEETAASLTEGEDFHPGRLLLKMLAGLAGVLFLLVLLGKFFSKRLGLPTGTVPYLSVLDSLSLGSGKGVVVIQAGTKRYLLGIGSERIDLLKELPEIEPGEDLGASSDFTAAFDEAKNIKPNKWQQTAELIEQQVMRLRRDSGKGKEKEGGGS